MPVTASRRNCVLRLKLCNLTRVVGHRTDHNPLSGRTDHRSAARSPSSPMPAGLMSCQSDGQADAIATSGNHRGLSHQHRAVQQRHGRSRELSRALQRSNMAHLSPMGNDADHAGPRISDDQQEQRPQVRSDAIQGKTGTSAAGRLTQAAAPEPQRSAGMGWARTRPESGSERQPALH